MTLLSKSHPSGAATKSCLSLFAVPPSCAGQVRLSTLRYFEQKFAVIHGNVTLRNKTAARYRDASFLQLSKIVSRINCFRDLRSRRSAASIWSRYCEYSLQIKNPASSAGHVRPFFGFALLAHPPERICSKLVVKKPGVSNQPHLIISETARFRQLFPQSGLR